MLNVAWNKNENVRMMAEKRATDTDSERSLVVMHVPVPCAQVNLHSLISFYVHANEAEHEFLAFFGRQEI